MRTQLWTACYLCIGWCLVSLRVGSAENTQDLCNRDPPGTSASKTPGDNGFRIKIAGRPPPERYSPEQVYTVAINGTYPNQRLLGFMLVAVPFNAQDETTSMGNFQHMNTGLTKFADDCEHVITHTYHHSKAGVELLWTAPPRGTGCVEFRATVIEYPDIWYKDDGALTKVFCEDTGLTENNQSREMTPDCCACGTAKYQMTFEGLWSRQTHPKDYPSHKRMLHWSNIVGASHSKSYMIWQYGDYASRGIKEVCEFGYSTTLEQEMRKHSHDVRSVIKTPGIWWEDPIGLRQNRWARFSVDRRNHLLTMLSMLGPSPDWCVGVSALNLCQSNCTWAGDMEFELYPWDAGTDDGSTYMSTNQKSDPQQKIHRITNTFPDNSVAPFWGPKPMKPLALLKLRRIHPKPGAPPDCTGNDDVLIDDDEEGFVDLDGNGEELTQMEKEKLMMMQGGKCATSDWLEWGECSVTCGVGKRMRKRMFLNSMVDETMCPIELIEAENCIGIENWCESPNEDCAMTPWSEWSPCSVTCGKGVTERQRFYLDKEDMARCQRSTDEKDMCVAKIMDCGTVVKNYTAICSLDPVVGPCRGAFPRWYYDTAMQKCLMFKYGGCRGNDNRFSEQTECVDTCEQHMRDNPAVEANSTTTEPTSTPPTTEKSKKKPKNGKHKPKNKNKNKNKKNSIGSTPVPGDAVDCMVTPWTEYSECSATCGKAFKYKRRMVKRAAENGGKRCPKKLVKKKKCGVPKCPQDCEVGPWGKWTPCPKTCGQDSIQERTRSILHKDERGGQACPTRLERRYCKLPACPGEQLWRDQSSARRNYGGNK